MIAKLIVTENLHSDLAYKREACPPFIFSSLTMNLIQILLLAFTASSVASSPVARLDNSSAPIDKMINQSPLANTDHTHPTHTRNSASSLKASSYVAAAAVVALLV